MRVDQGLFPDAVAAVLTRERCQMSRVHCLLILGLASCSITGSSRTAQASAPGQLDVQVMVYQGASVEKIAPALVRQAATVVVRSATGVVIYSGPTDTNGL